MLEKLRGKAEDLAAKVIPKAPEGLVRKLAGDPLVIDGNTLDPYIQLAAEQANKEPGIHTLPVDDARKATAEAFAQVNGERAPGATVHDSSIVRKHGQPMTVRIYRPRQSTGLVPGVLFAHQGGSVVGDLDTCDTFCSRVAAELGAVVVSIDYALAPEHKMPAQLEDMELAWKWLNHNAALLEVDPHKLVVCGDSAGGQLSAVLCQTLRDAGQPQPAAQVLTYPFVDGTAKSGSMISCAETFPLTIELLEWFWSNAIPDGTDIADPSVSPALHPNLGDAAPAIVVTAGFDPLRDQGIAFANALSAAGVPVIERCEKSLPHSFLSLGGLSEEAYRACGRIIEDMRTVLA